MNRLKQGVWCLIGLVLASSALALSLENRAVLTYRDAVSGAVIEVMSNTASIPVSAEPGAPGGAVSDGTLRFVLPAPALRIAGDAPALAVDADWVDADVYELESNHYDAARDGVTIEYAGPAPSGDVVASVTSASTGNTIAVTLVETRPDSGIWRSPRPIRLMAGSASDEVCAAQGTTACLLGGNYDDTLTATIGELEDVAVADAAGRVFLAGSGTVVAGAIVTVLDGKQPARHPVTDAELILTTDVLGRYALPRLTAGSDYALAVQAPDGFGFPSAVPASQLTGYVVVEASYGIDGFGGAGAGRFTIASDVPPPVIDIPLDAGGLADAVLVIEKRVERAEVGVGESIGYAVTVENRGELQLNDLVVVDTPPSGFRFVSRSARVGGVGIDDPLPLDGSGLQFDIGRLEPGGSVEIAYALQAGAGAGEGDGINSALATAVSSDGVAVASAPARVRVRVVRQGAFGDEAIVFGKVFVDASCDGLQNRAEWPVPGVRLYLEDGRFVITDEDGQYNLRGLEPRTHVLKLDTTSLPEGLALKPLDTRHAADAGSRFLPLVAGDFHRADFASFCPSVGAEGVLTELKRRREALASDWTIDRVGRAGTDQLTPLASAGVDGDLGRGWRGDALRGDALLDDEGAADEGSPREPANVAAELAAMGDPKLLVSSITRAQGETGTFLWPSDNLSDDGRFMAVVRGSIEPTLYVNDVPVPGTQIGERIENRREAVQIVAWYGVRLTPGPNRVEIRGTDAFGNARLLAGGDFQRPSTATRLVLRTAVAELPADGRSTLPIDLLVTDADGTPATAPIFVTLETSRGDFVGKDLQQLVPGHQVRVENGRAKVLLKSSERAGRLRLTARTSQLEAALNLVQLTAARPLIASGLLEGGASIGDGEDGVAFDSRAAVFMKGGIKGGLELTLAYDTDKSDDAALLPGREIAQERDESYTTTGDASLEGFEAQSRSKLYARVERDRHSLMWGDYLTDVQGDLDDLARVQRTLTGVNGVFDTGSTRLQAFAAEQSDSRFTEILPGNGTALLYTLQGAPLVANSEVIERVVASRDNPGLELSAQRLIAGIDYRLDPVSGLLSFADVVPSVDDDLNPVSIRASYDTAGDGEDHIVAGVRVSQALGDATLIGASFTEDRHPESGFRMAGIQARHTVRNTELSLSGAMMRHSDEREGRAARLGIEHRWGGLDTVITRFTFARAGQWFDNPGSGVAAGRTEWRLEHRNPLGARTRMLLEALGSESMVEDARFASAGLRFEHDMGAWTVASGARRIESRADGDTQSFTTALLAVDRRFVLGGDRPASVGVEYERALDEPGRFRAAIDARVGVMDHVAAYARYEREEGLAVRTLLGLANDSEQLVAGLESDWLPSTDLFSEYRLRGAFGGRALESVSGARGRYMLTPGLEISPTLEIVRALGGDAEDAMALSFGISDTRDAHRRLNARAEARLTDSDRYIGLRANLAQRLSRDWTALVSEEFTRQEPDVGEHTIRQRLGIGVARRPKQDNRHHGLYLAEWRRDRTPEFGADTDRFVLSTHQNREIGERAVLSGRLGTKWQRNDLGSTRTWQRASLAGARVTLDVARRFEFDVAGGMLATGEGRGSDIDDLAWSAGVGLSWVARRNLRLSVRWNALGFQDSDLDPDGTFEDGVRAGFEFKFDEEALQWMQP